jgi:hypothetical protein
MILIYINYMIDDEEVDLVSQADSRKVMVVMPEPVDDHLELLLRAARSGGAQPSRSQLLAALVAAAPTGVPEVARLVQNYLMLKIPDLRERRPPGPLPVVRHPGPRRR